jgi:hypothetical protein
VLWLGRRLRRLVVLWLGRRLRRLVVLWLGRRLWSSLLHRRRAVGVLSRARHRWGGSGDCCHRNWSRGNWSRGTWSRGTWSRGTWSRGTWSRGNWSRGNWSRGNRSGLCGCQGQLTDVRERAGHGFHGLLDGRALGLEHGERTSGGIEGGGSSLSKRGSARAFDPMQRAHGLGDGLSHVEELRRHVDLLECPEPSSQRLTGGARG